MTPDSAAFEMLKQNAGKLAFQRNEVNVCVSQRVAMPGCIHTYCIETKSNASVHLHSKCNI